jgi:hypothetical protein
VPAVRAAISGFALLPTEQVDAGMTRLAQDLESGEWARRHGDLLTLADFDVGLRLVVAG